MCLRWSWLTTCGITIVTSSANFTVFSRSAVLTVNTFPGLEITRGRVVITNTWLTRWKSPVLWRAKVTLTTVGLDSAGALATQLVTQIIWWTGLVAITSSKKKKKRNEKGLISLDNTARTQQITFFTVLSWDVLRDATDFRRSAGLRIRVYTSLSFHKTLEDGFMYHYNVYG